MLTNREIKLWETACKFDQSLRIRLRHKRTLREKRLFPVRFTRGRLFSSLARGEPVVFRDLSVAVRNERKIGTESAVIQAIRSGFPRGMKVRARTGRAETIRWLPISAILRRWQNRSAIVNVTDLHIRGTGLERLIDTSNLSGFNLLDCDDARLNEQEMLTLVISSTGGVTDSHTDDPDGSNHCFAGKKLWLVWDTFDGLANGLEDVERVDVFGQAAFNMDAFLKTRRSRWFTVEKDQTLFLPGDLTHKVITLEHYIGIGSFCVTFPSYLRTLRRWTAHTPLWTLDDSSGQRKTLVDHITKQVERRFRQLVKKSSSIRGRWGVDYLPRTVKQWIKHSERSEVDLLLQNAAPKSLVATVLKKGIPAGTLFGTP